MAVEAAFVQDRRNRLLKGRDIGSGNPGGGLGGGLGVIQVAGFGATLLPGGIQRKRGFPALHRKKGAGVYDAKQKGDVDGFHGPFFRS